MTSVWNKRVPRPYYGVMLTIVILAMILFGKSLGLLFLIWMTALAMGRLNDTGLSRWLALVPIAFVFGVVFAMRAANVAMPDAKHPEYSTLAGSLFLLAYISIGFLPGQKDTNRFGPPAKSGWALGHRIKIRS